MRSIISRNLVNLFSGDCRWSPFSGLFADIAAALKYYDGKYTMRA